MGVEGNINRLSMYRQLLKSTAAVLVLPIKILAILIGMLFSVSSLMASDKSGVVIYSRQTTNDVTALQLVFKGGFSQAPSGKEGLEALLFECLLRGGTSQQDSQAFRHTLDSLKASIAWEVQPDFSVLSLKCPAQYTAGALHSLMQLLLSPQWDARVFSRIQEERIGWLDHENPEPMERASRLSRYHYYKGTPYARHPFGTSASIAALTLNDLKTYHKNNLVKSAMMVFIVSPLSSEEITNQVIEPLSRLPLGLYQYFDAPQVKELNAQSFQTIKDSSGIPVLYGFVGTPALSDVKSGISAFLLASLLDQKLRQEFRLNRNLDVSVFAEFHYQRKPGVSLTIVGSEFKTYALILKSILQEIQNEGFSETEILHHKERLLTVYYSGLQDNQDLATHLRNWIFFSSSQTEESLPSLIRNLTATDLQQAWNTYFKHFHWTYIGLPSLLQADDLQPAK